MICLNNLCERKTQITQVVDSRIDSSNWKLYVSIDSNLVSQQGFVLENSGLIDKNGYKIYRNLDKTKTVRRHIHEEWNEYFKENRLSEEGKNLYQRRKEHVERSFADSKQNHGYRYAVYKGVKKNQHYTWLICATQNMKNISIKNDNVGKKHLTLSSYIYNFIKILENIIKILFKIKSLEKI